MQYCVVTVSTRKILPMDLKLNNHFIEMLLFFKIFLQDTLKRTSIKIKTSCGLAYVNISHPLSQFYMDFIFC